MPGKIYSYADSGDVANALGQYILHHQTAALKSADSFKIAVSGGSLGKALKKALIDNTAIAGEIKWDKWEVFFSDERLVPLGHPDSNCGLFIELVVAHLPKGTPQPKVHAINEALLTGKDGLVEGVDVDKDLQIAKEYEALLPKDVKLDVILLGCGPDGHTCSLFPGHKLLQQRDELVSYISDSPKPPPRRITITFPVLEKATSIAFVAEGAGKAPILKEIFNDASSTLPSKLVTDLPTDVNWFVNDAALAGVDVIASKY